IRIVPPAILQGVDIVDQITRDTPFHGEAAPRAARSIEEGAYRKVASRLVPFLMICYVGNYLDRVNVGFAKLQMLSDLRFSETVYGLGAGIFFLGYFLFEVPSNLILHRVGARIWIARIMLSWGILSACMLLVRQPWHFYTVRFLLGVAEAGFFPGIILYLTYWFPGARRARIIALFMAAIPLSGLIGNPISGWIMQSAHGLHGLAGWQWMFLAEAIPSVVLGICVLFYLDNGIGEARWLSEPEKAVLQRNIAEERSSIAPHPSIRAIFADRRVWHMVLVYFTCLMGQYAISFWLPTLIKSAGVKSVLDVGLVSAIPYGATIAAMIVLGRSSDRRRERRWHVAGPLLAGAVGLVGCALAKDHTAASVAALTVAAAGGMASVPLFWNMPTAILTGVAAAAGIAAINALGSVAGFVSPYLMGWLKDRTHTDVSGLLVLAAVLIVGAMAALAVPKRLVNR
ncbi:MAG TPA: MFS transporter, partial [Gemmatimonadales bacterium]